MILEYLKTLLNKYTFSIKPIINQVEKNSKGKVLNLFAGKIKLVLDEVIKDATTEQLLDLFKIENYNPQIFIKFPVAV